MLIIHGMYRFRPRRMAFRNDYCLSCAQPRRSVQMRTFDAYHILAVMFWAQPLTPDILIFGWVMRVGAPLGAILTLMHLLRTPKDRSLQEKLAGILPASDAVCPFCGAGLLVLSSQCSCPGCGVVRA